MSLEYKTKRMPSDPTLEQVKEWACDICNEIAHGFDGYKMPEILICMTQMIEVVGGEVEDETMANLDKVMKSLDPDQISDALTIVGQAIKGESMPDLTEVSDEVGQILGYLSMMRLIKQLRSVCHEARMVMASTMLSFQERANSINEISQLLDLNISDDEKHKIRNKLKGGTCDPVDVKSGDDLNDLCSDLFG